MEVNKILQGDCLEVLKTLPENSVDSIVTDPPYELGFMNRAWDSTGIANNKDMWAECLRVLKPGGHLLSFGGTRTYHRMACAIEDAGFEVRDMIEWVYGSGFPKSLNIGKAVDKLQGNKREWVGKNPAWRKGNGDGATTSTGWAKPQRPDKDKGTSEWEGWGTALKPAHEPICMARKPLAEKTVAENVLKYGTGGINIEASKVGTETTRTTIKDLSQAHGNQFGKAGITYPTQGYKENTPGRFPANLLHDNSEEVRECFPESKSTLDKSEINRGTSKSWFTGDHVDRVQRGDSGNASRFFKSIKTDELCTLCCLPVNDKRDTMSVCNNTNVNSAEKSLKTTQAITESIALENATGQVNKNLVQNVRSAGNLCDLCGTYIAQRLVEPKKVQDQELTLGELFMPERKKQILEKCLVSFVELMGNTDTIPTMENLNLLFGYVSNAIEEYTQKCEVIKNEGQNQWKSLVYRSKASKSERNKGCEGMPEKRPDERTETGMGTFEEKGVAKQSNFHPTVKPIALMEYLIKMVTRAGGIVLDPFAGSGSTLVAAKQNGYQYIGIELTPEYIPIIEARLKSPISQKLF